jgi:hypothetical protein
MQQRQAGCHDRQGRCGPILVVAALLAWGVGASAQTPQALPGLNPKETRADMVWTLRAGLNVAALQCQFSPFLATVPTYNALLRQHSDELADSFKVMTGYFVRTKGGRPGQRAFDTYATRTNQSWATFDAQYSFCNAAAMVGRRALATPKGKFGDFAAAELPQLRQSLADHGGFVAVTPRLDWAVVPIVANPCKGRPPERCR